MKHERKGEASAICAKLFQNAVLGQRDNMGTRGVSVRFLSLSLSPSPKAEPKTGGFVVKFRLGVG